VIDSTGGPVWCLAGSADSSQLAAACEDGTVRFFRLFADEERIEFRRASNKQKSTTHHVMSVLLHVHEQVLIDAEHLVSRACAVSVLASQRRQRDHWRCRWHDSSMRGAHWQVFVHNDEQWQQHPCVGGRCALVRPAAGARS